MKRQRSKRKVVIGTANETTPYRKLTHTRSVDLSTLINWTSPFPILRMSNVLLLLLLFE